MQGDSQLRRRRSPVGNTPAVRVRVCAAAFVSLIALAVGPIWTARAGIVPSSGSSALGAVASKAVAPVAQAVAPVGRATAPVAKAVAPVVQSVSRAVAPVCGRSRRWRSR